MKVVNLMLAAAGMAAMMLFAQGCGTKNAAAPMTAEEFALIENAEETMRVLTIDNEVIIAE